MKILYTSGPRSGQTDHVENSVGRFAISAGLAELIDARDEANSLAYVREENAKNPPDTKPRWAVVLPNNSGVYAIEMRVGGKTSEQIARYYGNPDHIHDKKNYDGSAYCSAFGWPVPEEIRDAYRKVYKRNPQTDLSQQQASLLKSEIDAQNAENQRVIDRSRQANEFAATVKDFS